MQPYLCVRCLHVLTCGVGSSISVICKHVTVTLASNRLGAVMKRIINGVTYNTETATLIAEVTFTDEGSGTVTEAALYQNRAGVYFDVDTITTKYRARHGDAQERVGYEWYEVGDAAAARAWTEKYEMTIVRDIEDMPPEAEPGEKLATLYVRLPPSLKIAVEEKAKAVGLSVNVFALRCLEGCVLPKLSLATPPRTPGLFGTATFDFSAYNGRHIIGEGKNQFDTMWTDCGPNNLYIYNDPTNIRGVAVVEGKRSFDDIEDASAFDFTSRSRSPSVGQVIVLQNTFDRYALVKIIDLKVKSRGADRDEVTIEYVINEDGSKSFQRQRLLTHTAP